MSDTVRDRNGRVNFLTYVQETTRMISEGKHADKIKCKLLIPENHMFHIDNREIKLNAMDLLRSKNSFGQYSKGSVDVTKNGRYYLLEYVKEVGWNR